MTLINPLSRGGYKNLTAERIEGIAPLTSAFLNSLIFQPNIF